MSPKAVRQKFLDPLRSLTWAHLCNTSLHSDCYKSCGANRGCTNLNTKRLCTLGFEPSHMPTGYLVLGGTLTLSQGELVKGAYSEPKCPAVQSVVLLCQNGLMTR